MASRSRRSSGGGKNGPIAKVIWFLVIAGLVVAFFKIPYDPGVSGVKNILIAKSQTVQTWANDAAPNFEKFVNSIIKGGSKAPTPGFPVPGGTSGTTGGTSSSSTSSGSKSDAISALDSLKVANASSVAYNRDEWKHWIDVRPCWTVREQVLATKAVPGSVVFKDKSGKTTKDINSACSIVSGTWNDPYSGKTFTNPSSLDIDHMVPLSYAAQHGAQGWSAAQKQAYANNLNYPDHLNAVSLSENRAKGDKGPSEWKPTNKADYCTYAKDWVNISTTWKLSTSPADVTALKSMLTTCAS